MKRLIIVLSSETDAIAYGAEIYWKDLIEKHKRTYYSKIGKFSLIKFNPDISLIDYIQDLDCDVEYVSSGEKLIEATSIIENEGLILDKDYKLISNEKGFLGISIYPVEDDVIERIKDGIKGAE